ncbi:MAG TPA: hypothetical protein VMM56_07120 [Planctomycetaceae bacterium]|nr:hypothetical protein [Planctomycetaceae bacterium]
MQMRRDVLRKLLCATAGLALTAGFLINPPDAEARKPVRAKARKAPPAKVWIAHVADMNDVLDEETGELLGTEIKYVVIQVSERAAPAHLKHGDSLDGEALLDGTTFVGSDYRRGQKIYIFIPVEEEEPPAEEPPAEEPPVEGV